MVPRICRESHRAAQQRIGADEVYAFRCEPSPLNSVLYGRGGLAVKSISEAQDLVLKLIAASGQWNSFDGPAIEGALRQNSGLWRSAFFAREASSPLRADRFGGGIDLIVLRDLPHNIVNLDTLFLLAEPGHQEGLEALASGWEADEVNWMSQDEAFPLMGDSAAVNKDYVGDKDRVILRVWWD
jgi:hypothetical protein